MSPFPKKSLGQNFLVEENAIFLITETIPEDIQTVIEIGPGKGAITAPILKKGFKLICIEIDDGLIEVLKKRFSAQISSGQLTLLKGDAASTEFLGEILNPLENPVWLVSNLPYNVGSVIFLKLLKWQSIILGMTLMFQQEVAERIASDPDSKKFGSPSVWAQIFYRVKKVRKLKPGAFFPPPNVNSVILRLMRRDVPLIDVGPEDFPFFEKFLRGLFFQRRKSIKNSLLDSPLKIQDIEDLLAKASIYHNRRAESLKLKEIRKLYECYKELG